MNNIILTLVGVGLAIGYILVIRDYIQIEGLFKSHVMIAIQTFIIAIVYLVLVNVLGC